GDLGFREQASRGFGTTNGDYSGSFTTQKNRYSTKQQVDFWVHLGAGYDPTSIGYWQGSLAGNGEETWTVRAGEPVEPVAEKILGAFHATGLPAILAARDSPGYPPEPDIRWARTFPHEDSDAASHTARRTLEPIAALLRPAGRDHDGQFANLADGDPGTRWLAVQIIGHEAADDPRALPALLNRLEYDPSAKVRREAARWLRPLARQAHVRHALQAAANARRGPASPLASAVRDQAREFRGAGHHITKNRAGSLARLRTGLAVRTGWSQRTGMAGGLVPAIFRAAAGSWRVDAGSRLAKPS